jgi:peptidoglycan/xylan/chitin deacetylase (PgdA/CDA1 family)
MQFQFFKKYKVHATFFLPTMFIESSLDDYPDVGNIFSMM